MSTTATWIAEAIATLNLAARVRPVAEPERSRVLTAVREAFLARPVVTFWWEHLKVPSRHWQTDNGYLHLPRLAPPGDPSCWLITGFEDPDEEKAVVECTPDVAAALIGECPAFEYALVDPALRWIVIENHHDVLIAAGDTAPRLEALRR